jgi:acyl-CoA reductase-like NAD-dependent aldehyde dehydrogenase
MSEALFPPPREDSERWLRRFITRERAKRVAMLLTHQEERSYWQDRVAECDEAAKHLDNLAREGAL